MIVVPHDPSPPRVLSIPGTKMPNPRPLPALLAALSLAACGPDPAALEERAVAALTRELPALQARYHAANGHYADHVRQLTGGADTLPSGIRILIHGGNAEGWSATSSHPAVPGAACAAFVGEPGRVPYLPGGVGPKRAGEVACMAFEPWRERKAIQRSGPFPVAP
jgi:hypothetical protein